MRVFVTGGTGALGRHAIDALVADGHEVSALVRSPQKAAIVERQGAAPVEVSLFDEAGLTQVLAGHDAVANLASALPPTSRFMLRSAWKENTRVRTEGSRAVTAAAVAAGVGVVVQESVSMLYSDHGDRWIGEDAPTDHYPMADGNHAAEANLARFSATGGNGVVLRLGWFYGLGATHSEEFFQLARRHVCIQMGRPGSYVSSIHVVDAGRAVAAALTAPAGVYNNVDDEPLTKRGYADALAHAAGAAAWLRAPGRMAFALGGRTTSLTRSLRVSNAKFVAATSWKPRYPSAREGWLAVAAGR